MMRSDGRSRIEFQKLRRINKEKAPAGWQAQIDNFLITLRKTAGYLKIFVVLLCADRMVVGVTFRSIESCTMSCHAMNLLRKFQ